MKTSTPDVDDILRGLGKYGRYQIWQFIYCLLCLTVISYVLVVQVFIGFLPNFRCKNLTKPLTEYGIHDEEGEIEFEYNKCDIDIKINQTNVTFTKTFTCVEGYEYDGPATVPTEWNLVCDREGLGEMSTTLVVLGQMIGASLFTPLGDKYGRHILIYTTFIALTACNLALAVVPWFAGFLVFRFLVGIFQQGFGLTQATLVIEMFPTESRSTIIFFGSIAWSLSISSLSLIGYLLREETWRYIQVVTGLLGIHCLATHWIQPESLRWLIANNKTKEAKALIIRAAKQNGKDPDEVLNIYQSSPNINEQEPFIETMDNGLSTPVNNDDQVMTINNTYTFMDILRQRRILTCSCIIWIAWFVNSLVYYGLFLTSSSLSGNRFLNYFLTGIVEIPSLFLYKFTVERFGRKKTCIMYHTIAGVSLITSVVMMAVSDSSMMKIFSTFFNLLGKFGISGSFTTIFLYTPEVYPTNLRNIGLGLASAAARIGGMLAPYASIFAARVQWGPGVVFGVFSILVTVLILYLPETTGKELPTTMEELKSFYSPLKGQNKKDKSKQDDMNT